MSPEADKQKKKKATKTKHTKKTVQQTVPLRAAPRCENWIASPIASPIASWNRKEKKTKYKTRELDKRE